MRGVVDPEQHGQLSFLPGKKIISRPPSIEHIPLLKSHRKALEYACELADVEPKEVCGLLVNAGLRYDTTKWARILKGERTLPSADITKLNSVLGNNAYLQYLNYLDGIDLSSMRKRGDDKDRVIADQAQEITDLKRVVRMQTEAMAEALAARRLAGK